MLRRAGQNARAGPSRLRRKRAAKTAAAARPSAHRAQFRSGAFARPGAALVALEVGAPDAQRQGDGLVGLPQGLDGIGRLGDGPAHHPSARSRPSLEGGQRGRRLGAGRPARRLRGRLAPRPAAQTRPIGTAPDAQTAEPLPQSWPRAFGAAGLARRGRFAPPCATRTPHFSAKCARGGDRGRFISDNWEPAPDFGGRKLGQEAAGDVGRAIMILSLIHI